MKKLLAPLIGLLSALPLVWGGSPPVGQKEGSKITWKKTVVDKEFRSEGVAVADFNKDGKMDIFVGDCWYEAPDWKRHVIRRDKPYDPINYSESFGAFAGDFNGDGWADVMIMPFPGKECFWYENPGKGGGKWKEHVLATSACNETPIYIDLFKNGKKVLVMGWQPPGKDDQGELCYFTPGSDPTKLWEKHSISGPSAPGKEVPGTRRFSHGLGHGDINGDGRIDILCPDGWWEQPEKIDGQPWKFHRANLGPTCADMYVFDVDGDGNADVISSSAHNTGLWWHQQKTGKDGPMFLRHDLFPHPTKLAQLPKDHKLNKDEQDLFAGLSKVRQQQKRTPWRMNPLLSDLARSHAQQLALNKPLQGLGKNSYPGKVKVLWEVHTKASTPEPIAKLFFEKHPELKATGLEVGLGFVRQDGVGYVTILVGDAGHFALPSQSHALHFVDIDGDGLKDLVTGRRYWAHGPHGDDSPADPAYLYWYRAVKKDGKTDFIPELIDDDSGIGTQFEVVDINGDGLLDIVVSNKKGVFIFEQVRPQNPPRRPE